VSSERGGVPCERGCEFEAAERLNLTCNCFGRLPLSAIGRLSRAPVRGQARAEPYDMWLVMHGDLKRTARARAVADAVVEAFEREEA
jgi:hypothetical protein